MSDRKAIVREAEKAHEAYWDLYDAGRDERNSSDYRERLAAARERLSTAENAMFKREPKTDE